MVIFQKFKGQTQRKFRLSDLRRDILSVLMKGSYKSAATPRGFMSGVSPKNRVKMFL